MSLGQLQHEPIWGKPHGPDSFRLVEDTRTDVCIVGAGIAGLSTAYQLAKAGKSVIVLDDGPPGGGQTGLTTAHLANAIDDRFQFVESVRGLDAVRMAWESHGAAVDAIERIVREEKIECFFERLNGYLFRDPSSPADVLEKELDTLKRARVHTIEMLPKAPVASFDTGPCLRFPRQGQFHPLKYLEGLTHAIQKAGGKIFSGTHVERVDGGEPATTRIKNGPTVTAGAVVVATNSPINDLVATHTKQASYQTYAIAGLVPRDAIPHGLYWDTLDPYHYVRLEPIDDGMDAGLAATKECLIVGGEDHHTGNPDNSNERYARLEGWTRERFPMVERFVRHWSGEVRETFDGLGFIGRNPFDAENSFIATGDSGMGMTHGTIAGLLISDLILGRNNPWTELYSPSRHPPRAMMKFAGEALRMAGRYADWVTGGDVSSVDEIKPGSGGIVRRGLHKIAAYRDESGQVHEYSASCTHLGCVVHWNQGESTWDCPCHGSRFNSKGEPICGPANTPLAPACSEKAGG